jgi:hypothetical protein
LIMADFPSTLPAPLADGYAVRPVDQTVRTEMDVGPARARRITRSRLDRVPVSWVLTDEQLEEFRTWFDDDDQAAGGAAWFNITLKVNGGGASAVEARFTGAPAFDFLGADLWRVSGELEVRA